MSSSKGSREFRCPRKSGAGVKQRGAGRREGTEDTQVLLPSSPHVPVAYRPSPSPPEPQLCGPSRLTWHFEIVREEAAEQGRGPTWESGPQTAAPAHSPGLEQVPPLFASFTIYRLKGWGRASVHTRSAQRCPEGKRGWLGTGAQPRTGALPKHLFVTFLHHQEAGLPAGSPGCGEQGGQGTQDATLVLCSWETCAPSITLCGQL